MNYKKKILWSAIFTLIIEIVTIIFRFGFNMQSTRDTATTIGALTGGIRIHHGYIGLLVVIIYSIFLKRKNIFLDWLLIIGIAMVFSDLVHHFFVLWIITGDPEFHLVYPNII